MHKSVGVIAVGFRELMQIGRRLTMWFRFVFSRKMNRYSLGLYQDGLVRPVNQIGRVKTRGTLVYIRMYRAYIRAL